ncbi:MAG: hypothetical protein GKR89_13670 [Candidatus Latescibacteria bacterium]|nr:hypothetical protein [Candidatus Latescibacterota bacterium]
MIPLTLGQAGWLLGGQLVNAGSPAEGLLTNVRMVNSVFEDAGPQAVQYLPADFDPNVNTSQFVDQIPSYAAHGVNAFTLSMQGGMPGYEGAVNSAFNADGSLRGGYIDRVGRGIRAAGRSGCGVILSCLYQRQHSHARSLQTQKAIHAAVANTAAWIAAQGFTHVVLEIANEFAHAGYANWPDGQWLQTPEGQVELIATARAAAPGLLVSTSGMGSGRAAAQIAAAVDFLIIHFNNTANADIPARIAAAKEYGKAVVCNEDDKTCATGAEAARLSIAHGSGWGFMHKEQNQSAPFVFAGSQDDPVVYAMLKRLTTPGEVSSRVVDEAIFALITQPRDGDRFAADTVVDIVVDVAGIESDYSVALEVGDLTIGRLDRVPWTFRWTAAPLGGHDLVAIVYNASGVEVARSRPVDIVVG